MQDGMTATNPQTGEKVVMRGGQWVPMGQAPAQAPAQAPTAPRAPDRIFGAPKQPDPVEAQRLEMERQRLTLAQAAESREQQKSATEAAEKSRKVGNSKLSAIASIIGVINKIDVIDKDARDNNGWGETGRSGAIMRGVPGSAAYDLARNIETIDANSAFSALQEMRNNSPTGGALGAVTERELDLLKASIANLNPNQSQEQFLANLKEARQRYVDMLARLDPEAAKPNQPARPEGTLMFNDQIPEQVQASRMTAEQEQQVLEAIRNRDADGAIALMERFTGNPRTPESEGSVRSAIETLEKGGGVGGFDYDPNDEAYKAKLREEMRQRDMGEGGIADTQFLASSGLSLGNLDEIGGAVSALMSPITGQDPGDAYTLNRDMLRLRREDALERRGVLGHAAEFGGSLAIPVGGAGALGRTASATERFMAGARPGAIMGGLAGAGYSEGGNTVPNALLGATTGGVLGGSISAAAPQIGRGVNALMNLRNRAPTPQRAAELTRARDVADMAQTEGIPMGRGILDPQSRNAVTALETTPGGSGAVRQGMQAATDAIESRVGQIADAPVVSNETAGRTAQGMGDRFIKDSGKMATRMYDRARQLAGDARVNPQQALTAVDQRIAQLSETPTTNRGLISYLEDLKSDLSRDGGLSIDALRRMRTNVRGQVDERSLTTSDADVIALEVLDAASDDIVKALANKPGAATAFKRADASYRARMEYINDIVANVTGPKNRPLSGEKALARINSMMKDKGGDARRFRELMRSAQPQEREMLAANVASSLGRNTKGEFSPALLISQAEQMSSSAKLTMFGPEGARSLNNLVEIAREFNKVTLNSSRAAVANNYRGWLGNALGMVGGSASMATTGDAITSIVTGAITKKVVDKAQTWGDARVARALMNPDVSAWIRRAPRTTNPDAINRHVAQIAQIAARNPSLVPGIRLIQERMTEAAVAPPQRAAASGPNAGQDEGQRREQVPQ